MNHRIGIKIQYKRKNIVFANMESPSIQERISRYRGLSPEYNSNRNISKKIEYNNNRYHTPKKKRMNSHHFIDSDLDDSFGDECIEEDFYMKKIIRCREKLEKFEDREAIARQILTEPFDDHYFVDEVMKIEFINEKYQKILKNNTVYMLEEQIANWEKECNRKLTKIKKKKENMKCRNIFVEKNHQVFPNVASPENLNVPKTNIDLSLFRTRIENISHLFEEKRETFLSHIDSLARTDEEFQTLRSQISGNLSLKLERIKEYKSRIRDASSIIYQINSVSAQIIDLRKKRQNPNSSSNSISHSYEITNDKNMINKKKDLINDMFNRIKGKKSIIEKLKGQISKLIAEKGSLKHKVQHLENLYKCTESESRFIGVLLESSDSSLSEVDVDISGISDIQ